MIGGLLIGKFNHAQELKITFEIDHESSFSDIPAQIDRNMLVTIIGNLVDNAMEAVLAGGDQTEPYVKLFLTDLGEDLIIECEDRGVGIPEETSMAVFEKGFSTKEGEHRGIGLALVQHAVGKLSGYITFHKNPAGGTIFTVAIPKIPDLEGVCPMEPQGQTVEVLIVEDDVKIAEINRRFIEKVDGFHVVGIATDLSQAKEQLEILTPNLVLLDVYLPGANGLEMLSFIRQHYRETDVIMITAAKEIDAIRDAIRSGAFDYIIKPLVFNRLQETLVRYLDFHRELSRMNQSGMINQSDVDRLMSGTSKKENNLDTSFLPKGIDKLTLVKIVQAISGASGGLTADQIAKEIGVSRSTGRRYLEHLVSSGDLYADLSYGVVGRPERVYRRKKA